MKRKLLIVVYGLLIVLLVAFLAIVRVGQELFGNGGKRLCSTQESTLASIPEKNATVELVDELCDNGPLVNGVFKIVFKRHQQGGDIETVLLIANNSGSMSVAPKFELLSSSSIRISVPKDAFMKRGPSEVAGIKVTYNLY
jgi:hypothetical protein